MARGAEGTSDSQVDKRFADPSCFFALDNLSWMQASQEPGSGVLGPLSHTPGWDFYEVPVGNSGQSQSTMLHVRRDAPIRLVRVFSRWPSSEPPLAVALRPEGVGVAEVALPKPAVQLARLLVAVCPSAATLGDSARLLGGEQPDSKVAAGRRPSNWRSGNGDSLIASAAAAAAAADAEAKELESRNSLRWRRAKPWPSSGSAGEGGEDAATKPPASSAAQDILDTNEALDGVAGTENSRSGGSPVAGTDGSSSSPSAGWRKGALSAKAERRGLSTSADLTRPGFPQRAQASSVGAEMRRRTAPAASLVAAAAEAAAEVPASPQKRFSGLPFLAAAEAAAAEVSPLQAAADAVAAEARLQAAADAVAAEAVAAESSLHRAQPRSDSLQAAAEAVAAEGVLESEPSGETGVPRVGAEATVEIRAGEEVEPSAPVDIPKKVEAEGGEEDFAAAGHDGEERSSPSAVRMQEAAPPQEGDGEAPEEVSGEEKLRLEVERLKSEMEEHRFALKLAEENALRAETEARKMREERDDTIRRLRSAERATMLSDMQVRNLTNEVADMRRQQQGGLERRNTSPNLTSSITSFEDVVKSLVTVELTGLRNCTQEERAAAKRKLLLRWHPDKNGGTSGGCGDLATRVVQEMQGRAEWATA